MSSVVTIKDTPDSHGGTVREITAVDISNDTVSEQSLLKGYTAHNSLGEPISGNATGFSTAIEPILLDVDMSVEEYELDVDDSGEAFDLDMDSRIEQVIVQGANIPEGGAIGDIMMKRSLEDYDIEWVTPASSAEQDNTRPITSAAVYTEIGNINALLATI